MCMYMGNLTNNLQTITKTDVHKHQSQRSHRCGSNGHFFRTCGLASWCHNKDPSPFCLAVVAYKFLKRGWSVVLRFHSINYQRNYKKKTIHYLLLFFLYNLLWTWQRFYHELLVHCCISIAYNTKNLPHNSHAPLLCAQLKCHGWFQDVSG